MNTSTCSIDGSSKKVSLEELSKEELIKKCRNYLTIAQKAKQARDALTEENSRLKASDEIIETLTQQKVDLMTKLEEQKLQIRGFKEQVQVLETKLVAVEERSNMLDTENQSFGRQVIRLTEENEQLLVHLDGLEKQIAEMNRIGLEQQQQLLVLEENSNKLVNIEDKGKEVTELQNMLARSLEEIKKLKQENEEKQCFINEKQCEIIVLNEQMQDYLSKASELESYKQELVNKDIEIARQVSKADDLNTELHKNKALAEKLKNDIKNLSHKLNENQIVCSGLNADMENANEKLKEKVKLYHSRIVKISGDVKKLRESKDYCLEAFKMYNNQVNLWKIELTNICQKLKEESLIANEDRKNLNDEITTLKAKLQELQNDKSSDDKIQQIKDLQDECNKLKSLQRQNESLNFQVETFESLKNENGSLQKQLLEKQEEISKFKENLESLESQNIDYQTEISQIIILKEEILKLQTKLQEETNKFEENNKLMNNLKKINSQLEIEISELNVGIAKLQEENKSFKENQNSSIKFEETVNELTRQIQESKSKFDLLLKENEDLRLQNESNLQTINLQSLQVEEKFQEPIDQLNEDKIELSENLKESNHKENEVTNLQETQKKLLSLQKANEELNLTVNNLQDIKSSLEQKTLELNEKIALFKEENKDLRKKLEDACTEMQNLQTANEEMKVLKDAHENEKACLKNKTLELEQRVDEDDKLMAELRKVIAKLEATVEDTKMSESKLAEQNGEIIQRLSKENKELTDKIDELEASIDPTVDVNSLKQEYSEMLAEMNEMNNVLKERGETINKLQAHVDELLKKINTYEVQLASNQETIKRLQDEMDRDRDDCETLSTSTISRSEDLSRLKDLEGSWEERYSKLRNYALKLKAKAKELQESLNREREEKAESQNKLTASTKNVQLMQEQIDRLQDQLEKIKSNGGKVDYLTAENLQLQKTLNERDEMMVKLKERIESLNQEKTVVEEWKKQIGLKVQSLRKELEANVVIKKDFEERIRKLQSEFEAKTAELNEEKERHKATRIQLQEINNECKKQSVLNLEMQDYERSIKDLAAKLERKNEQIIKLKNQIDGQKSTVNAVKEQNRLIEEKSNELEREIDSAHTEIKSLKKLINDLEGFVDEKDSKIEEINNALEYCRGENEELSTQLSKVISEHQKVQSALKEEKDHFRTENVTLQQKINELDEQLKMHQDELKNINSEYQGYKVRAQSVLRQNQSRDVGLEERLTEEAASFKAQISILQNEIDELKSTVKNAESINEELVREKRDMEKSVLQLQSDLDSSAKEIEKLNWRHQQALSEHNETVRNLKLHSETLSQCYRQQLSEQEVRHNREIIELQSKVDKNQINQLPPEIPSLIIPSMLREEGEGSESVDSNNGNNIHPLEKLLGAEQDQEMASMKKQLNENEMRVLHLTALLSDTEQDLAKHVQMNKVLKEEIRRQQRSVERERHAENLEYLKNVVFKFVTLNNGDERLRLVPVLNTILKLSPDEAQTLTSVAKGEKSWANYLPMWSSNGGGSSSSK